MPKPTHDRFDPVATALGLREQIASGKRKIGFFFGAGTSICAGIPGLDQLTSKVAASLTADQKVCYGKVIGEVGSADLESILSYVRLIREFTHKDQTKSVQGITGEAAQELDVAICQNIYKEVSGTPIGKLNAHRSLSAWIRYVRRDSSVEIFTTNYDLLFETAFEQMGLPFFDGFVGVTAPFFAIESVEADSSKQFEDVYPPRSWARLWKLHGSVGWQLKADARGRSNIVRMAGSDNPNGATQLVIYPSRDKYMDSRKLPFIAYQDRLRRFLLSGETLLVVLGYSFRDQHMNEVLAQALRANTRLAVVAFMFDEPTDELIALAETNRNLSVFSPKSACIGGDHAGWLLKRTKQAGEEWPFWDEVKAEFVLGNFAQFATFLDAITGLATQVAPTTAPASTPAPSTAGAPAASPLVFAAATAAKS
jgi:hypothetical protein